MKTKDEELENIKGDASAIEDIVFVDFCRDINLPDIRYYEKNHLWYL